MQSKHKRVLNQLLGSLKLQDSKRLITVEITDKYQNANSVSLYVGDKTFRKNTYMDTQG